MGEVLAAGVAAFVVVLILTRSVILIGSRGQWWEPFSPRGSHTVSTLGRGGIGFVIFLSLAFPFYGLAWLGGPVAAAFTLAGLAIAFIGLLDDARPLPVLPRIGVHILAVIAAGWVLRLHFVDVEAPWFLAGVLGAILVVVIGVSWVWCVNLFNFMDGIDGIAAAEVGFVGVTASIVCALTGHLELSIAWALLAGSALGFLVWNAPPARIFMGDVGSGYLGFIVGGLLILSVLERALTPAMAILLIATFLLDATITLGRRAFRGERWYQSHRQHAFQHLAARWESHAKVTLAYAGFNIAVVGSAIALMYRRPDLSLPLAVIVLSVGGVLAWWAGAGTAAPPNPSGVESV
jgi:Fuc2NAc and GlcNAc transferase